MIVFHWIPTTDVQLNKDSSLVATSMEVQMKAIVAKTATTTTEVPMDESTVVATARSAEVQ